MIIGYDFRLELHWENQNGIFVGINEIYNNVEKMTIDWSKDIMNNAIGSSNGDEINRDINNIQETTKDKDSEYYNTWGIGTCNWKRKRRF